MTPSTRTTPQRTREVRHQFEQVCAWFRTNQAGGGEGESGSRLRQAYLQDALAASAPHRRRGGKPVLPFAPFRAERQAASVLTPDQLTVLCILALYWGLAVLFLGTTALAVTLAAITLFYVGGLATTAVFAAATYRRGKDSERGDAALPRLIAACDEIALTWPSYTILAPLYHEGSVARQFVSAMRALDYPADQLQVLFLTEADDTQTRAALDAALRGTDGQDAPPTWRILTVPEGGLHTKPRALNFGLMQATGQFTVIYDAEDKPAPDQLKRAVLTFALSPAGRDLACVQGRLNCYNSASSIVTRLFTAEYSTWFDLILPGLERAGLALPLGGTSNHFRTDVLRALGGWDAFNVTEDCDMGLRLSQYGFRTQVLDSTTLEEAPSTVRGWAGQRSRWVKGYLQTYLVHMRHPWRTLRRYGPRHFLSLQIVGSWSAVLFCNPLMWGLTAAYAVWRPVALYHLLFPGPVLYVGAFCFIFGNFLYLYIHMLGCATRGHDGLVKWMALLPLYWLGMSLVAYLALFQLVVRPHHWQKTKHGGHLPPPGGGGGGDSDDPPPPGPGGGGEAARGEPAPDDQDIRHEVIASLPTMPVRAVTPGTAAAAYTRRRHF